MRPCFRRRTRLSREPPVRYERHRQSGGKGRLQSSSGCRQVPTAILVGKLDGVLENGGHRRVHGPADVEYLHQPIEMLQYVDALGETKRIDSQQRGDGRIGAKHPYVFAAAEDVLGTPPLRGSTTRNPTSCSMALSRMRQTVLVLPAPVLP